MKKTGIDEMMEQLKCGCMGWLRVGRGWIFVLDKNMVKNLLCLSRKCQELHIFPAKADSCKIFPITGVPVDLIVFCVLSHSTNETSY